MDVRRKLTVSAGTCVRRMVDAEPVGGALDPEMTAEVLAVMEELAHEGMTMIAVTHEMGLAEVAPDRVAIMVDGRISEEAPRSTSFSRPASHERSTFSPRSCDIGSASGGGLEHAGHPS